MTNTNTKTDTDFRVIVRSNVRTRKAGYKAIPGYSQLLVGGFQNFRKAVDLAKQESGKRFELRDDRFRIMFRVPQSNPWGGEVWKGMVDCRNAHFGPCGR